VSVILFIFISEELLDAELPKETPQETSHSGVNSSMKVTTAALTNKEDGVTSIAADKQTASSMQGLQLPDRLGTKVTSGSVLDRLGVRKVTTLYRESDSSMLRITDRLGDKIIPPVTDRLGNRKVDSLGSDDVTGHKDSDQEDKQYNVAFTLSNRPGARVIPSGLPTNRTSMSVMSQSERCNVSVAQVAPTAVNRMSKLMNVSTEAEQLGQKTLRRPLAEEETADKDQVRVN
jgi:hypothetical protein